jgi:intraflagellar transport protein 56
MMHTRASTARRQAISDEEAQQAAMPTLVSFIDKRDFVGALTLLEFNRAAGNEEEGVPTRPWLAYCHFHLGAHKEALAVYQDLASESDASTDKTPEAASYHLFAGICHFYLGDYEKVHDCSQRFTAALGAAGGDESDPALAALHNRLLFHTSHKERDDDRLFSYHERLHNVIEDQLTLAAVHYMRSHYSEAASVYKAQLDANPSLHAINLYLAMAHYRQDIYDTCLEYLQTFSRLVPDASITPAVLRACTQFRLYNGAAGMRELQPVVDAHPDLDLSHHPLIELNSVVFQADTLPTEVAVRRLAPFIDAIPEARLNSVILLLQAGKFQQAWDLMEDFDPSDPLEFIIKGVAAVSLGQETSNTELIQLAQQAFQLVGSSPTDCDTIPGRQAMASYLFLLEQFEDSVMYLDSIKEYFLEDDAFNFTFGIATCEAEQYAEASAAFARITDEAVTQQYTYQSWAARAHVRAGEPRAAWELYLKSGSSTESLSLLQLIANECYAAGRFFYACKAFDILERLDPSPEYWQAKRGAAAGVLRQATQGEETAENLQAVVDFLRNSTNPEAGYIVGVIRKYLQRA